MQRNKLLKMLARLPEPEFKAFRLYMKKQHSRQHNLLRLLDYLKDHHPKFDSPRLDRQVAFPSIFGKDTPYHEKNLLNLLSKLRGFLEDFLLNKTLDVEAHWRDLLLMRTYKRYRMDELYRQKLDKMQAAYQTEPESIWTTLYRLELLHEQYFSNLHDRLQVDDDSIFRLMEMLDEFFMIAKLNYATELYTRSNVVQFDMPNIWAMDAIQEHVGSKKQILLQAYSMLLNLLRTPSDELFFKFKALVLQNLKQIETRTASVLLNHLLNYTALQLRHNRWAFITEANELYNYAVPLKLFINDNHYFKASHFLNIVNTRSKCREFDLAKQFIEDWSSYLNPVIKTSILGLSWAVIHLEEKEFNKAAEQLALVQQSENYNDLQVLHKIWLRAIELAIAYELKDDEYLSSRCNAFEQFLRRDVAVNDGIRRSASNYISFIKKLKATPRDPSKLLKELRATEPVYCKHWLEQKVESLLANS